MPLAVQLVSPEQILFEGDAEMVICRALGTGDLAILSGHAPFVAALASWPVRVLQAGGGEHQFAVHGGFVEVSGDHVVVLSDVAELPTVIDVERAVEAKQRAESVLAASPEDVSARNALTRAETRLAVAKHTT